jgi:hypothetical protein
VRLPCPRALGEQTGSQALEEVFQYQPLDPSCYHMDCGGAGDRLPCPLSSTRSNHLPRSFSFSAA